MGCLRSLTLARTVGQGWRPEARRRLDEGGGKCGGNYLCYMIMQVCVRVCGVRGLCALLSSEEREIEGEKLKSLGFYRYGFLSSPKARRS